MFNHLEVKAGLEKESLFARRPSALSSVFTSPSSTKGDMTIAVNVDMRL